jgi:mono/diheme cytochrome c family protein
MRRRSLFLCTLGLLGMFLGSAVAQERAKAEKTSSLTASAPPASATATHETSSPASPNAATDDRIARLEGERRFRTNCGRCHQAPHKFPPRVMAAAIRHMRVRALITDEDMRYILRYMTQ